jgi:hypothetical protein
MKVIKVFSWVQGDFTQFAVKSLSSDSKSARISATASTETKVSWIDCPVEPLWWPKYNSRMAYLAVSADLDSWWRSKRGWEISYGGGNYRTSAPKVLMTSDNRPWVMSCTVLSRRVSDSNDVICLVVYLAHVPQGFNLIINTGSRRHQLLLVSAGASLMCEVQ